MKNKWLIDNIYQTTSRYPNYIFNTKGQIYTFVNPYKYHMIRNNVELYKQMDGVFVDGILMVLMYKLLYRRNIRRLSFDMTAVARDLFEYLSQKDLDRSIYFIGSQQELIEKSIINFQKEYPDMKIAGYRNGYFNTLKDRDDAIEEIIEKKPDFVIVGLGGNIQEQFALDLKSKGYNGIVFTCGGFLHQSARDINYYPKWIDKFNLRGVYRIFKERNFKRLPHFITFLSLFSYDRIHSIY